MKGIVEQVKNSPWAPLARRLFFSNPWRWLPAALKWRLLLRNDLLDERWVSESIGAGVGRAELAQALVADTIGVASPLLDLNWYRSRYGMRGSAADALLHFILLGDRLGLKPHPWFDASVARSSAVATVRGCTLSHYLKDWRCVAFPHAQFDQEWYLQQNEDVREAGVNPLIHFVLYGQSEGRKPNFFFEPDWYREANPDVAASGMPPALHYALYGAFEGRNPGPEFDVPSYQQQVTDTGRLDALSHYLTIGRQTRIVLRGRALSVADLTAPPDALSNRTASTPLVDVIVPVYRGLKETRACIDSVIASMASNELRLHIYNDASPEPEVTAYLRDLAQRLPFLLYVENEVNLGFVGTVNRAMRAAMALPQFDSVILLNSDAEVSGDWARRLREHAGHRLDVATVTAMSNNATICSYPQFGENRIPDDESHTGIDALARQINLARSAELPTGVGFCMLITRRALEKVGLFDEQAFGKGYGEEVDFCQKAIAAGFKNLLALDTYVLHAGEVSFASASKPSKIIAEEIIRARYPHYQTDVSMFVRSDPAQAARLRLTFARWRAYGRQVHVLFTHALGGGTERHVKEVVARMPASARAVIIRPAKAHSRRLVMECVHSNDEFHAEVDIGCADDLARLLTHMGTQRIEIHHALGFGEFLREGIATSGLPFDFLVHDYFTVCPQVTMTDAQGRYCGETGLSQCDACIAQRPSHGSQDIRNWRIANEGLVLDAQRLAAPSHDCAARIERYFGRRPDVASHEPLPTPSAAPVNAALRDHKLRILVLGTLAPHKGRQLVLDLANEIVRHALPVELMLIGDPQVDVPREFSSAFKWTGRYQESELDELIARANADVFLFPSQAPETYSYTLTAAMRTGLPIVATQLGSFMERLADYPLATTVSPFIAPMDLLDVLQATVQRRGVEGTA